MAEPKPEAKRRKVLISIDDVYSSVFQRYSSSTVIAMYQEMWQVCGEKIDWKLLARRTSTGITNAREYQMVWRHLAYGHPLDDKIDEMAEPLDDNSDLEIDLEATPPSSAEEFSDARASVQVLIASGPPSDVRLPTDKTDGSLVPYDKLNGGDLDNSQIGSRPGANGSFHPSFHNQVSQGYKNFDGLDVNGSNLPFRKKRNPWTDKEDKQLIAAVKKCGEGNWATILRGDFTGDRSASQLSQRWAILKKRLNPEVGGANVNGQQISKVQLATRNALSVALNGPSVATNLSTVSCSTAAISPTEPSPSTFSSLQQSQDSLAQGGASCNSIKNRGVQKKPHVAVKPSISSKLLSAAVAANARIATPEEAKLHLEATQGKTPIRIIHGGSSVIKSTSIGPSPRPPHSAGVGSAVTTPSNSKCSKVGVPKPVSMSTQSNTTPSNVSEKQPSVQTVGVATPSILSDKFASQATAEFPTPSNVLKKNLPLQTAEGSTPSIVPDNHPLRAIGAAMASTTLEKQTSPPTVDNTTPSTVLEKHTSPPTINITTTPCTVLEEPTIEATAPKAAFEKGSSAQTAEAATPGTVSEKHPPLPTVEVTIADQYKATEDTLSHSQRKEDIDKPKECHPASPPSAPFQVTTSENSESDNLASDEQKTNGSIDNGESSTDNLLAGTNNVATTEA